MSDNIDFNLTEENVRKIEAIMDRALGLAPHVVTDWISVMMDLAAANGDNGNPPLDLDKLLAFDDFSFLHDVVGIVRHMNRETGKLDGRFMPRCVITDGR